MTEDQKKALIIGGGLAFVAMVAYFATKGSVAAITGNTGPTPLSQYSSNIPPPYQGSPVAIIRGGTGGGCCSSNDGCFTTGGINTGNAPTSLDQLLAWYAGTQGNAGFGNALNQQVSFVTPDQTLMALTSPPQVAPTNVPF